MFFVGSKVLTALISQSCLSRSYPQCQPTVSQTFGNVHDKPQIMCNEQIPRLGPARCQCGQGGAFLIGGSGGGNVSAPLM